MSKDLIEGRWNDTKSALMEGLVGTRKSTMGVLLENTRRHLMETASAGATTSGNIATLNRIILPIIRRVMPSVIANELVGIQPMTSPVGQITTLRVRYGDNFTSTASPANGPGTDVLSGEEALSPFKIAQGYTGTAPGVNSADGRAGSTSALEGVPGRRLNIQLLKQVVEARNRKVSARWTIESAQDSQSMYGMDLEAEIMAALAHEITSEIDQEILYSLRSLAATEFTFDQAAVSGTATFVGDEHAALAIMINRVANMIAQRTRRGPGNWAVVSSDALTVLQSATTSAFARTTEGSFEAPTNTKFVGTLNNAMKIYVDGYAQNNTPVLVGYKGPTETDAAAFFCPYIPLMSSGVVVDPNTLEQTVGFMTRYGYVELTNTASSFGNAGDYLGEIALSNLSFQ